MFDSFTKYSYNFAINSEWINNKGKFSTSYSVTNSTKEYLSFQTHFSKINGQLWNLKRLGHLQILLQMNVFIGSVFQFHTFWTFFIFVSLNVLLLILTSRQVNKNPIFF